jgi:hypothetical protein
MKKTCVLFLSLALLISIYSFLNPAGTKAMPWYGCCGILFDGCGPGCCVGYNVNITHCDIVSCDSDPNGWNGTFTRCHEV